MSPPRALILGLSFVALVLFCRIPAFTLILNLGLQDVAEIRIPSKLLSPFIKLSSLPSRNKLRTKAINSVSSFES